MENKQIQYALEVAIAAAKAGAKEIIEGYGKRHSIQCPEGALLRRNAFDSLPGRGTSDATVLRQSSALTGQREVSLFTEYDLKSEKTVRNIISKAFPNHAIIGEEEGLSGSPNADYKWYIDPLDGSTNFAHGHPFFSVSIGLVGPDKNGEKKPLVGVIKAPALGEFYWGCLGGGAFRQVRFPGRGLVEKRLTVTGTTDLHFALLNTGYPYDIYEDRGEVLHPCGRLLMAARSVRRVGAASLDIAYVAAGIADAFWGAGLKPWDVAAGLLLLSEAGGKVSDYQGQVYQLGHSRHILGSNGHLHDIIMEYLN